MDTSVVNEWVSKARWGGVLLAGIILVVVGLCTISDLLLNLTPSVPVGIYKRSTSGKYAAFCPSRAELAPAFAAGLQLEPGICPATGLEPILKPLYRASRSHPIRFAGEGFYVDGRLLPNTAPKMLSAQGKPLTHYPFGTYESGAWAISDYSRDSWDSRYLGPVKESTIHFYAAPVLTTEGLSR